MQGVAPLLQQDIRSIGFHRTWFLDLFKRGVKRNINPTISYGWSHSPPCSSKRAAQALSRIACLRRGHRRRHSSTALQVVLTGNSERESPSNHPPTKRSSGARSNSRWLSCRPGPRKKSFRKSKSRLVVPVFELSGPIR
jgi:hypothetical protein